MFVFMSMVKSDICQMSNAYVDPRDMLNNFCFYVSICASLSGLQYGISFGNKKPDNVNRAFIVLLSNLIEGGTVQCIVE